jgi:hypothetical protein
VSDGLDEFLPDAMPADEAEERIARIGAAVETIWPDLIALYQGRAWVSLGLPSWQALCDERMRFRPQLAIEERRPIVREMTGAGMSTRAIGTALGVDPMTVIHDRKATRVESSTPEIAGLDGKTYTRPAPIDAAEAFLQSDGTIRAANLRKGFAQWAASIHRVHLFDPTEIAALDPELGDGIEFSVKRLNEWWTEYQTARRQGLRVIEGGNA